METKPLLYGLIGFFAGALLVSTAATTFNKPETKAVNNEDYSMGSMSMDSMTADLQGKMGDEYDKVFIANMIEHHEGAVEMARQSAMNAKHDEIINLSKEIIAAQENEITKMKQWQKDWGYTSTMDHEMMGH